MANNVAATPGTGLTFKTTDTAGVHVGHVNVDISALPAGAATAAKQPALGTAGASSTDVISVQGIASGTAMPVSLASVPSHAVTNAGTFAVQAALSAAIPAGTNNIGDVDIASALPAGTNNIGSVDVLTVGGQAPAFGTGLRSAATQRVTIATDDSVPVTIASVPSHAVTNAGTFAVQSSSVVPGVAATSLGKAEDAAHASGDTGVAILGVRRDTAASGAGTDGDYATLNLNSSGRLYVSSTVDAALPTGTNTIGKIEHTTTGIGHGVKTVTTAGTDLVLASSTPAKWVTVQAQTDNTGWIAIGATGVDATVATGTGVLLAAGESLTVPCDNLADIFIDATVSGDGARYTYGT